MKKSDRLVVFRLVLGCHAFLMVCTTLDTYRQTQALGVIFSPRSEMLWFLILMSLGSIIGSVSFLLTFTRQQKLLLDFGHWLLERLPEGKPALIGWVVTINVGFAIFSLIPFSGLWNFNVIHWLIFGWVVMD